MGWQSTVEDPSGRLLEPCCFCHFHKIKRDDLNVGVSGVSRFPQMINELSRGAASMIRLRMLYLDILYELPELSPEVKISSGLKGLPHVYVPIPSFDSIHRMPRRWQTTERYCERRQGLDLLSVCLVPPPRSFVGNLRGVWRE